MNSKTEVILIWSILSIIIFILIYQLVLPPIIGLANNGDFALAMTWAGLDYKPSLTHEQMFVNYIQTKFIFVNGETSWQTREFSSEILFEKLAVWISHIFDQTQFDLRVLGSIHIIFFGLAVYLIISSLKKFGKIITIVASSIIAAVFLDVGYISYFNSFYKESSVFIFSFLSIGFFLKSQTSNKHWYLLGFFIAVILLACTTPEGLLFGIIVAFFGIRMFFLNKDKKTRQIVSSMSVVLIISAILFNIYGTPMWIRENFLYDSVFNGILPLSKDPGAELKKLGLPTNYTQYPHSVYNKNSPVKLKNDSFEKIFFTKIHFAEIVKYYLSNPEQLYRASQVSALQAFNFRPLLGNFEQSAGLPPRALAHSFDQWTNLKHFFPNTLWFIFGFFASFYIFLAFKWRKTKNKLSVEVAMLLPLMAIAALVSPYIGVGATEIQKHMYLFNILFDTCIAIICTWLGHDIILKCNLFRKSVISNKDKSRA